MEIRTAVIEGVKYELTPIKDSKRDKLVKPLTLKLKIKTLDELISIYELFNKSSEVILESYKDSKTKYPFEYSKSFGFFPYWKKLDKILKSIYKESNEICL